MRFLHAHGELTIDRCHVMGIVNRTPDSFYDGGRMSLERAVAHAEELVEQGADIIDIGAVKAGPGPDVSEQDEIDRLVPLVAALHEHVDVPMSIETGRGAVAKLAFDAGAAILNDVTELADEDLLRACVEARAGLVVMHHGGQIRGRPRNPRYDDVVRDVLERWTALVALATGAGIPAESVMVDPGLDFGKNTFHSLELVRRLPELVEQPQPVLLAASRKDIVGETLGLPPQERLEGSLVIVAAAVTAGVAAVRVHDVKETVRAVQMTEAILGRRRPVAPIRGLWE
ncbi:MAG: dihydropteroate synthase [Actinomycetota bacterium]